jgi:hypothetical protein
MSHNPSTCPEKFPSDVRHEAVADFSISRNELEETPRCVPAKATKLKFRQKIIFHWKLTLLDSQLNCHKASWCRFGVTDGLANVFSAVLHLNVGDLQATVDIARAWRQLSAVSAAPRNASTDWTFVAALEDDLTTYSCAVAE